MTKFRSDGIEATTTWRVVVRRHDAIVHEELLETFDQAADVVAEWGDVEDTEIEVTDLRGRVDDGGVDGLDAFEEEQYPHA